MGIIMPKSLPCRTATLASENKWEDAVIGQIFARLVVPAFVLLTGLNAASAEAIAIGNYGSSANGMPFGVALAKGYFQAEGANVTSIIASEGGGTSVRNAMISIGTTLRAEAAPGCFTSLDWSSSNAPDTPAVSYP